jgi:signal recognition particle GTPase
MAFEGLSEKLQGAFKDLKGQGVVSEKDFDNAMRVVKMALLEADVNFKVVKEFVATIKEKALGAGVLKSLTPDQMVIKIVKDETCKLVWECPNCHNRDQSKMHVTRRTCGYIGTQFWNQGRTQEIQDRVLHLSCGVCDVDEEMKEQAERKEEK